MLTECANPGCHAPFRYLHEGRLFNVFEAVPGAGQRSAHVSRMELYWLCNECVKTVRIVLQEGRVTTRPLNDRDRVSPPKFPFADADALVDFC